VSASAASSRCGEVSHSECSYVASNKLGPSLPCDPASLMFHALERSTETLLGNGAREKALECTDPGSTGDRLARAWVRTTDVRAYDVYAASAARCTGLQMDAA
jgi:hypothetical protein